MGIKKSSMLIRKSRPEDINRIMQIYADASAFMQANGNPTQWPPEYMNEALIRADIAKDNHYVCCSNDAHSVSAIVGVFYFAIETEPAYLETYNGSWINQDEYGVVHRIATDQHSKGIASYCLDWCFAQKPNLRIDTHEDNTAMRRLLEKSGFCYCGVIYVEDGSEMMAFQKTC